jgi:hypothetical protein
MAGGIASRVSREVIGGYSTAPPPAKLVPCETFESLGILFPCLEASQFSPASLGTAMSLRLQGFVRSGFYPCQIALEEDTREEGSTR